MGRYDTLAKYYEILIQDEQAVERWFDFTLQYIQGSEILELACGCGDLAFKLAKHGFHVTATDLSAQMIEEAKSHSYHDHVDYQIMDMLEFETNKKFDSILCYCDSFNYLSSYEECQRVFDHVRDHLNEAGVFLFDMHSMDRLKEFEEEYIEEGMLDNKVGYQWTINSEEDCIYQHLAFYTPDGIKEEEHVQTVFDPFIIKAMLEKNGFEVTLKTDFDLEGVCEGEKIFVIGRKIK